MMAHFGTFNTRGIGLDEALEVALRAERSRDFRPTVRGITVGLSSGTSGHRGLFLVSAAEQAAWAGILLGRTLPGLRGRGYTVAFFLRSNSNLYERIGGRWLRFRYYDLMAPREQAVAALNREPPDFLVGPPSLLALLAAERIAGRLRIVPQRLIAVAEVLEPQDRDHLAEAFGAAIHQVYQCTEGLLAVSCPHGSLHIQEDLVAVQLEPLGAPADVCHYTPIVTDLWRRTQPILRYRLNDVVTVDPRPCPCGSAFRVLASVEGRCDDMVSLEQHAGGLRPVFPDTIRRMLLLSTADICDYQVYQDRPGRLRVHLEVAAGAEFHTVERAVRASIAQVAHQHGCRTPEVIVERGVPARDRESKRRRLQRLG